MELSLAESPDDDLEDRDDDAANNFDVVVEEEESPPLTIPMPSSPSYTNHTIHSSAIATAATSATTSLSNQRISSEAVCTPIGECEFCPPKWRVMIEKEEQTIKDEYESCIEYGRRIQFECTVLFQADDSMEKIARNIPEYRSCQFTASDDQYRMFRMQLICLLLGMWSLRNVRRQRVVSASLFDQRRMRIQGSTTNSGDGGVQYGNNNNSNSNSMSNGGIHSSRLRRNSTEASVELTHHQQKYTGYGKVPKSPAPDINGQDSNMQTV